jgi:hypothetical protein
VLPSSLRTPYLVEVEMTLFSFLVNAVEEWSVGQIGLRVIL